MALIECKYYIQNDYYTVLHILRISGARGVADALGVRHVECKCARANTLVGILDL